MATIADLKAVRQELINKTPLLYQGEVFDKWDYVNGETKLNPPNTPSDFKLVLIKEAINIWDNKTYNLSNLTKIFKPNSDLGNWEVVLKGWLSVKNTLKLDDWSQKGYLERRRAVPEIYEDWDNEITQLTTDKATAETSLKKYTDTLGTSTPAELKDKLTTLDQAKSKAEQERDNRPNINLTDYQNLLNNQEKHTDYDTIKKERDNWVVVFPSPLTPDLVKVEYDKPKEVHTDYDAIKLERDQLKIDNANKDMTIDDLNHTIKDKDKVIEANKDLPNTIIDLNKQLSDKDIELGKRTDTITSLEQKNTQWTGLKEAWVNYLPDFIFTTNGMKDLRDKITDLVNRNTKLREQQDKGDQYLTKLLAVYKKQITEQTKNFYLENLKLDESDDIRPKYKDKITEIGKNSENDDYTVLLDKLNKDSKPQEVINAFKLLALICATEKAVKESSEWMTTNAFKNKILKEHKLNYFVNLKNHWNRLKDLEPGKENNPLYHKDTDEVNKDFWKEQLDETIRIWQT